MDVNDLRVVVRRNAARFDEAAQLPFQEAADAQPVVKERARP